MTEQDMSGSNDDSDSVHSDTHGLAERLKHNTIGGK